MTSRGAGSPTDTSRSAPVATRLQQPPRWLIGRPAWVVLILGCAVLVRLFHFTGPPDDLHEWRQAQTLLLSSSYQHGANWLTPTAPWFGAVPRVAVLEFPIYSLAAYFVSISGLSLLLSARLVALATGLAAIVVFDRVCALRGHPRRATAVGLFALTPLAIFYSHAVQPDGTMLFLALVASYCGLRGMAGSRGWLGAAGVILALASSIKPAALLVVMPALFYDAAKRGALPRAAAIGVLATVGTVVWGLFDQNVLASGAPDWLAANTSSQWLWGPAELRLQPNFYGQFVLRLCLVLLPPGAFGLVVLSLRHRLGDGFWWCWAGGGVVSILTFATLNYIHVYYQLPLVPALAALAGAAAPPWPRRLSLRTAAAVATVGTGVLGVGSMYAETTIYRDAGWAVAGAGDPGKPVIVMSQAYDDNALGKFFPDVLYYADRPGWNASLKADGEALGRLTGGRACTLVVVHDGAISGAVPTGWTATERTSRYVVARSTAPACR